MANAAPTLEEQIEELEREHAVRERIYPRWMNATPPKLTPWTAEQRQARLRAAIATLKGLKGITFEAGPAMGGQKP